MVAPVQPVLLALRTFAKLACPSRTLVGICDHILEEQEGGEWKEQVEGGQVIRTSYTCLQQKLEQSTEKKIQVQNPTGTIKMSLGGREREKYYHVQERDTRPDR